MKIKYNVFILALQIKNLYINEKYQDSANLYASDIALLVLEESIHLSAVVAPACIETGTTNFKLQPGHLGKVLTFFNLAIYGI